MKVAVVTGASRGIGLEASKQLVSKGFHVLVTARDEAASIEAARVVAKGKGSAEPFALDVTRPETIAAIAKHLQTKGVDVLVNNAGVAMNGFDANVARTTIDVNFHGPRNLTAALLPLMRPEGRIVMVSSGLADRGGMSRAVAERFTDPSLKEADLALHVEKFVSDVKAGVHRREGWPTSAYGVSKSALNALALVLSRALQDDDRSILVNAVCPGWVRTRMGGDGAPVSVEDGARGVVWAALLPPGGPTGGFFRDEAPASW